MPDKRNKRDRQLITAKSLSGFTCAGMLRVLFVSFHTVYASVRKNQPDNDQDTVPASATMDQVLLVANGRGAPERSCSAGFVSVGTVACNKLFPSRPAAIKTSIFTNIMGELKHIKSADFAVATKTGGNPEGKGANGFLADWYQSEPRGVVAKPRRQLLAELFTSMLVLSATFKFRPVVGAANYLYWIKSEWSLSLIAPDEWSHERRVGFAGTCVLQRDMTSTSDPSDLLADANPVSDAIRQFYDAFAGTLETDLTLEEILPYYVGRVPYYQRLYANALSRSVSATMVLGDQSSTRCRHWYMLLPQLQNLLPAHRG
jgi:hypothetical protein